MSTGDVCAGGMVGRQSLLASLYTLRPRDFGPKLTCRAPWRHASRTGIKGVRLHACMTTCVTVHEISAKRRLPLLKAKAAPPVLGQEFG